MYMPFFVLHFGIFLHIMAFYLKCKGINSYNLENARLWILLWIHVYEDSEYRTRNIVQYMNSGGNIWIQGAPLSEWVILKPSSDAEFSAAQPGGPDRSMQKNIVPYDTVCRSESVRVWRRPSHESEQPIKSLAESKKLRLYSHSLANNTNSTTKASKTWSAESDSES